MEYLVEFDITIPSDVSATDVEQREEAEAAAAATLVEQGHLVRVWRVTTPDGISKVLGLYLAEDQAQLDGLLRALPMYEWMKITTTALEPHPNDPGAQSRTT